MSESLVLLNKAVGLQNSNQPELAFGAFLDVLAIDPNNGPALFSLALIRLRSGDQLAAKIFAEEGVSRAPEFAPLWLVYATILQGEGDYVRALDCYNRAIALQPDYIEALNNSGALLRSIKRHHDALVQFNRILVIDPGNKSALANCAILLTEFKQNELAINMFEKLLAIAPDYDFGLGLLAFERLHICDWKDHESLRWSILQGVREGRKSSKTLALMAISDSAEDHYHAACIFGRHYCPPSSRLPLWEGTCYRHEKIRIAYVSPDLREHPVGHLIAGVIERHDKTRFEVTGISLGTDDKSRLRARFEKAFDRFIDASAIDPRKIAEQLRNMEVDIVIDLAGYTSDARVEIYSHRPAPAQITFLGYCGTLGLECMDYLIADPQVVPPEHWPFYTEKVLYLPQCYLPTDASIRISERTPTRKECGLPEDVFVFCAFSHDYKINPPMFDVWMRLLSKIPRSVLWLVSRNELSIRNLRKEAEMRGVSADRLIFAQRVPLVEDHLARYRQASLFLDTYPYNAHTTAADALYAGLPVLTCMGNSFPSRVAGSLLRAIGLPELAAQSFAEYEALALSLALNPDKLHAIRVRLIENKSRWPLFDTVGYCRQLESLYISVWRKSQLGLHSDEL